jgi:hypothetical protein
MKFKIARLVGIVCVTSLHAVANSAFAVCLNINIPTHNCRYPSGDEWCYQKYQWEKPFAYLSQCHSLPALKSFDDYPVKTIYRGKPAKVDLSSHPNGKMYRTTLRDGMSEGVNFAGSYTVTSRGGCGISCEIIMIVNTKTGKIIGDLSSCGHVDYNENSRLLIVNPPDEEEGWPYPLACQTEYYLLVNNKIKLLK